MRKPPLASIFPYFCLLDEAVAGTNSTVLLFPDALSASLSLVNLSRARRSLPRNASSGNPPGFHSSGLSVVSYCAGSPSGMPTKASSLLANAGFRIAAEFSSLALKCVPCFFSVKNWSNFLFVARGGEPGGEGGMSKSGTAGSVRSWRRLRLDE